MGCTVKFLMTAFVVGATLVRSNAWIGRPSCVVSHPVINGLKKSRNLSDQTISLRGGTSQKMALANNAVTTSVPIIGVLTSTLLYFSPFAAVRTAVIENALGDLNSFPLAIMAASSLCWLVYGLSIQNIYVTLSNLPGFVASIWYVTAVLPLLKDEKLRSTQNVVVSLSAVTVTLWTWLSLTNKTMEQISSTLGTYASLLFIILCSSPLLTIRKVLSTRNSRSILISLTLAQVTNTALWAVYGLTIGDKFVWGPNVAGLIFGLIQLALKILCPSKQPEPIV